VRPSRSNQSSGVDPVGDLITRIAGGDQAAFAQFIDRRAPSLSAVAAQMLGDVHMAEDIVQTVFLKTWQMLPEWEPGRAKLMTWMRRVTVNQCLDNLRKSKPLYTDNLPEIVNDSDSPETALSDNLRAAQIKRLMAQLPDRQKMALTLFYYQELSLKEAAGVMGISPDAFESLVRRARAAFKQKLQSETLQ